MRKQHPYVNEQGQLRIVNAEVVTESGIVSGGSVWVRDGRIAAVGSRADVERAIADAGIGAGSAAAPTVLDAEGGYVVPGFIDVHVHGGYGHDFMEAGKEGLDAITRFHGRNGTTAMLATTVTAGKTALDGALNRIDQYASEAMPYTQVIGVHLEGPFISHKYPGAQNPAFIVPPQLEWMKQWVAEHPGLIVLITLAPEVEGAMELIDWLVENGIIPASGHTEAGYDVMQEAAGRGLRHGIHTFNGMRGLHHREPGTAGTIMLDERFTAEVIADGHHVHPACIRLLAKVKTENNLIMITDAMNAAGLGDGDYKLGGLDVVVNDGVARLKEGGSLAGSTLTMIGAFRYMVREVGLSVVQASQSASGNPARLLGIYGDTGSIAVGKRADLLLLSPELDIRRVWVLGRDIEA